MKISEIFYSLQGEGLHTGRPTIFIRFYGCPVQCSYCDSKYTWDGGYHVELTPEQIMEKVKVVDCENICITGGDPDYVSTEDMYSLLELLKEYTVSIEASGYKSPVRYFCPDAPKKNDGSPVVDLVVMDIKGPSSTAVSTHPEYISLLRSTDQVKFLVADGEDFDFMVRIITEHSSTCEILISPVMTSTEEINNKRLRWLSASILKLPSEFINRVRFNYQLHKLIWGNERGR